MVRVLKVLAKNFYLWCLSESFKERPDGEGTESMGNTSSNRS